MTNVLSNNCSTYDQDKIKDIFKNKIKRCAISPLLLGKANYSFCFPGFKLRGRPRKQWNSLNLVLANFSSFKVNHYYLVFFNWYQFFRFRTYIYIYYKIQNWKNVYKVKQWIKTALYHKRSLKSAYSKKHAYLHKIFCCLVSQ